MLGQGLTTSEDEASNKRKMSMSGQAIKLQANKTGAGMTSILDAQEKCPVDGVNMTAQNLLPLLTWK